MWKVEKTRCLALKVGWCVCFQDGFILDGQLKVPSSWGVHLYMDYKIHLHLCNVPEVSCGLSHFQAPGCPLQGSSELHLEKHTFLKVWKAWQLWPIPMRGWVYVVGIKLL